MHRRFEISKQEIVLKALKKVIKGAIKDVAGKKTSCGHRAEGITRLLFYFFGGDGDEANGNACVG